jgi:NADPH-dependent 2,4-dienoyl-CoA reductase/sulfur reductase-like enzyme
VPGSPEYVHAAEVAVPWVSTTVREHIAHRRENPSDDATTHFINVEVDGRKMSDDEIYSILERVISGGVGTTASLVTQALVWLYENPDQRQRLIDDPSMIDIAVEEFLRVFSPTQALARTIMDDTDFHGCPVRKGDRALLSWASANRDATQFENPDEVDKHPPLCRIALRQGHGPGDDPPGARPDGRLRGAHGQGRGLPRPGHERRLPLDPGDLHARREAPRRHAHLPRALHQDGRVTTGGAGPDSHVVVVGGGLATARLVGVLRRKKFEGRITVVSGEDSPPYDRPPLSKDVLTGKRDETTLPFDAEKLGVDLRLGTRATGLSTADRTLVTDSGDVSYDLLAIATGAAPLRMPGDGQQLTLRTLADALSLRSQVLPGARVVVIGASWIGAEVSTAALAAGCRVTCVEYGPEPFVNALGPEVGALARPWWDGVDLRTGTAVASVEDDGVHLVSGEVLAADVVVTGVGVRPDLSWLAGSGLTTDRGVLTDTRCRTNVRGVVALGDVAQRWSHHTGTHRLAEHWDEASTVATAAVGSLLDWDDGPEHDPVPYFWSDLFGRKLQYVGAHAAGDELRLDRADDGSLGRAVWSRDGVLTAWLGVDAAKDLVKARTSVGGPVTELG